MELPSLFKIGVAFTAAIVVLLADQTDAAPIPSGDYVVHEWGTFTSINGSDGTTLAGIQKDEEPLPPFVYSLDIASGRKQFADLKLQSKKFPFVIAGKGLLRPVQNVTVKMETPVLYFYSPESFDAQVSVGFKGGSISQWYPARFSGEVLPPQFKKNAEGESIMDTLDFAKPYNGSIEWKFKVEPRTTDTDFDVTKHDELPNWIHPRAPRSNLLRTPNGEAETYLFYRGLGNFQQPLSYQISNNVLSITSKQTIPYLIVVDVQSADYGRVLWSGAPGKVEKVALKESEPGFIRKEVYHSLKGALVKAGLYDDEASAMLRTWWQSYFSSPGIRAFWIVPRSFTDDVLPITIQPTPDKLERVLLGRSEILTPEFEDQLLTEFSKEYDENAFRFSRYFPAYQARVDQLRIEKTVGLR
tara:strand:- start:7565 stop:8806 length:1242 start_codon:yes stop_codon:yes gene_type:complete